MLEISQIIHKAFVLVCENRRDDGRQSCGVSEPGLKIAIKEAMKTAGLPVRVLSTSCMDHCKDGPIVSFVSVSATPYTQLPTPFFGDVHVCDVPELVTRMKAYLETSVK